MNRFRGCFVPRPDWIKVLYLFGTLGLHRLLTKTLKLANETVRRKMARFASLTDQYLDVIIDEKDSKNTKSVIRVSEKILNDYLKEKDGEIKTIDELDSADVSVDTLNTILRKFYGEVRKADGTCYAKKSMITVRFGLQKHFL